jgi:hypothetical protein
MLFVIVCLMFNDLRSEVIDSLLIFDEFIAITTKISFHNTTYQFERCFRLTYIQTAT